MTDTASVVGACIGVLLVLAAASAVPRKHDSRRYHRAAQKRTESLQDVPLAVSAVAGDKIAEAGITKIEDLKNYVPTLFMTETAIGNNISIRGIFSGVNPGFEQSVGTYVDGVYRGRPQQTRAPFLDLERVEVLRGPQSILFGKNSVGGALTSRPRGRARNSTRWVAACMSRAMRSRVHRTCPSVHAIRSAAGLPRGYREMDGHIHNGTLSTEEPSGGNDGPRLAGTRYQ